MKVFRHKPIRDIPAFKVSGRLSHKDVSTNMPAALNSLQYLSACPGPAASALRPLAERNLLKAILTDAIQPFFQPMVALPSGAVVGFEILARWTGPSANLCTGPAGPDVFIALAESAGLLPLLTEKLLRAACIQALRWPQHLTLAVNVAPRQLADPDLPEFLRRTVEPTGFPLARLEVELTEQMMSGSPSQAAATAARLRQMGVCLVMDDFGVGASDLQRLEALCFDKIKLDRSMVRALDEEESSKARATLRSAMAMARDRGLIVVAEGIETEAQARVLHDLQCQMAQGWLFGRPTPGHQVAFVLAAGLEGNMP
jgi:EAL domain-containing protein (putative c-di-GMP-specific phosphodiesterase class I)